MKLISVKILGYTVYYNKITGSLFNIKDSEGKLCVMCLMQAGLTIRENKITGFFSGVEYLGTYSKIDGTDIIVPNRLWADIRKERI
jgi:hypothetical protein